MTEPKKVSAGTQITEIYYDAITRLVSDGKYMSESDFIRQAIIEKLRREGALSEP